MASRLELNEPPIDEIPASRERQITLPFPPPLESPSLSPPAPEVTTSFGAGPCQESAPPASGTAHRINTRGRDEDSEASQAELSLLPEASTTASTAQSATPKSSASLESERIASFNGKATASRAVRRAGPQRYSSPIIIALGLTAAAALGAALAIVVVRHEPDAAQLPRDFAPKSLPSLNAFPSQGLEQLVPVPEVPAANSNNSAANSSAASSAPSVKTEASAYPTQASTVRKRLTALPRVSKRAAIETDQQLQSGSETAIPANEVYINGQGELVNVLGAPLRSVAPPADSTPQSGKHESNPPLPDPNGAPESNTAAAVSAPSSTAEPRAPVDEGSWH